jgi:hypothetical protein
MDHACTIGTPCHEDWNRMTPQATGRHCTACDLTVIDLTSLSPQARVAALGVFRQRVGAGERVCVRGHLTRDGLLAGSRRVLTGGMAMMLAMAVAGCTGDGVPVTPAPPVPAARPAPGAIRMGDFVRPLPMGAICAPPAHGEAKPSGLAEQPSKGKIVVGAPVAPGPQVSPAP